MLSETDLLDLDSCQVVLGGSNDIVCESWCQLCLYVTFFLLQGQLFLLHMQTKQCNISFSCIFIVLKNKLLIIYPVLSNLFFSPSFCELHRALAISTSKVIKDAAE